MTEDNIVLSREEYERLVKLSHRIVFLPSAETQKNENLEFLESFTDEQIKKCFEAIENHPSYKNGVMRHGYGLFYKERDKTIFATFIMLGLRPKECLSIKFEDINLKNFTLFIHGENNKQRKDRVVPLSDDWIKVFERFITLPKIFWEGSEYLFPSFEDRTKPLSPQSWKSIMREKILKPLGFWVAPKPGETGKNKVTKFRTYSLRHYFAQKFLSKSDGDLNALSVVLGHKDLRCVHKYLNFNSDYISNLRNIMNKQDKEGNK